MEMFIKLEKTSQSVTDVFTHAEALFNNFYSFDTQSILLRSLKDLRCCNAIYRKFNVKVKSNKRPALSSVL
jgi:hypothetical protein